MTLPRGVREQASLPAGAAVDIVATSDGVLITAARVAAPDQSWFWTEAWQEGEREADEDARLGRSTVYESGEAFLAHLREVHDELIAQGR